MYFAVINSAMTDSRLPRCVALNPILVSFRSDVQELSSAIFVLTIMRFWVHPEGVWKCFIRAEVEKHCQPQKTGPSSGLAVGWIQKMEVFRVISLQQTHKNVFVCMSVCVFVFHHMCSSLSNCHGFVCSRKWVWLSGALQTVLTGSSAAVAVRLDLFPVPFTFLAAAVMLQCKLISVEQSSSQCTDSWLREH